jgi:hypothetical protein
MLRHDLPIFIFLLFKSYDNEKNTLIGVYINGRMFLQGKTS